MGRMRIMGRRGDSTVEWHEGRAVQAQEQFDEMLKKGYLAFKADGTKDAEQVKAFDPNAEELILIPQLRGGC